MRQAQMKGKERDIRRKNQYTVGWDLGHTVNNCMTVICLLDGALSYNIRKHFVI